MEAVTMSTHATQIAPASNDERDPDKFGRADPPAPSPWPAVVVAIGIMTGLTWGFLTLPWQAMLILSVASVAAFVGWIRTNYRRPVRSRRVIATYLCAVAFQFIHMSEEYNGHFPHEFTQLFRTNHSWSEHAFLIVFVFGFGALWTLGAAGSLYQIRIANYFLWFYALGAGLLNAISHFVFPIIKGGYFPGLYTAAGHLFLSALLIVFLLREPRSPAR
jgi:hypothetical protein